MNKPTEAQIKKFWEWCGWQIHHDAIKGEWISIRPDGNTYMSTVDKKYLPLLFEPMDLNNLFKYAVPKAHNQLGDEGFYELMKGWTRAIIFGREPALALFWAIYSIIEGDNQ